LAEVYQAHDRLDDAIKTVEQLEPTTYAALSLGELYCEVEEYPEVVQVTEGVTNEDDATAMLCVFRGIAFREQKLFEAARQSFKEALRTKKRDAVVRHRALLERARTYEAEGKRAMARKDLERIMAEDSNYEGLDQAIAELF
jgi:tetratricopeptide (TPR) repeat protein